MRQGLSLVMLAAVGCSAQQQQPLSDGCRTDEDCKEARICDAKTRLCMDPPTTADGGFLADLSSHPDLGVCGMVTGPHSLYATNALLLPGVNSFAIDIDGGGRKENQLKSIVGAISAAGFDLQGPIDAAIKAGRGVFLFDEESPNLTSGCASLTVNVAEVPFVPPTFGGSDNFAIDAGQMAASLIGQITNSKLNTTLPKDQTGAQVQTIVIHLPLAGGMLPLTIYGAHVQGQLSPAGIMSGEIHGVIRQADINSMIIPAIADLLTNQIRKDPTGGTTGTIVKLFEDMTNPATIAKCMVMADCCAKSPTTCKIVPDEVKSNSLIQNVLAPDVQAFTGTTWMPVPKGTMKDSLSVGLGFTAVKDTFQ